MAAFTWNIPAAVDAVISTTPADNWLAAMNAAVVANSGGANASWEVANYSSASPKSLLLRRKNGAPGRILFFGQNGSTPHANAVRGTPLASALYVAYSESSTANAPDASFLTGAPLAAADYMPGVVALPSTASFTGRLNYAEFPDGFLFLPSQAAGMAVFGAGALIETLSGSTPAAVLGSGGSWGATWSYTTSAAGAVVNHAVDTDVSYTPSNPGLVARIGGANRLVFRAFQLQSSLANFVMHDPSTNVAYFLPIAVVGNSSATPRGVIGKLRQMAFGPQTTREANWLDSSTGTLRAYGHSYHLTNNNQTFWLLNAEI